MFYFALGGVAPIAMQVLRLFNRETIFIADYLQYYLRLVPVYNLNSGFIKTMNRWVIESIEDHPKNSLGTLDWACAGEPIFYLVRVGVAAGLLLILVENNVFAVGVRPLLKPLLSHLELIHESLAARHYRIEYTLQQLAKMEDDSLELTTLNKKATKSFEDKDPLVEEARVRALATSALRVSNLTKSYSPLTKAVDGLSFALDFGECFALLGITGAGKTTTFKCLC